MPTPSLLTVVSSTPSNDAMDGAQFLMYSFWAWALLSSPDVEFFYRIRSGPISYLLRLPLA
jgi:hypothetical protein